MEQAVEQHRLESRTFEVKMNQVLSENERLLAQAIDKDIVKTVVNLSVNASDENVPECQKCLELETELVKKKDFVDKETYDNLCKCFTTLEKHCITLEPDSQLNQEMFQQKHVLNQNAPIFYTLFEISEFEKPRVLKRKTQIIVKLKEQIKFLPKRDVENSSETRFKVIAALKNELRKLKGKAIDNKETVTHSVDPNVSKDNMEPITPKLLNKRTAHSSYIKHTPGRRVGPLGIYAMPSDNLCVSNAVNVVKSRAKPKKNKSKKDIWKPTGKVFTQIGYIWRPTGRTFTIVGNACPLTRITTTNEVPSRKPIVLDSESPKPVVKLVYSRKPRKNKNAEPVAKLSYNHCPAKDKGTPVKSWDPQIPIIPSTSLTESVVQIGLCSLLVPNPSPSTPFVPPSRSDWDLLFQPMFDESLNVDFHAPEVIAPIPEAVAPEHAVSTGSPSSTTVDQDAPSPSTSHTTQGTQTPILSHDVEEDNHDIEVAHMGNDPYFGIPIPEVPSDQSSSDVIHTIVHPDHQVSEHTSKWTKDHPLENIIGALDRPVPHDSQTFMNNPSSMHEELHELLNAGGLELFRSEKQCHLSLSGSIKVKLDELGAFCCSHEHVSSKPNDVKTAF
ncbi:hypothetical protein Tco_0728345 [Tanacetum coccineum]|uniref:Integrase, catalytic region, zinc finger, CCHC-type, peptidase aspartic, catalytic n=1 Tax=Tanacetum coccineum TaxID=301880 RepID=A0ABQ4YKW3_9ASTR